ncbi:MAG: transposase, partial [Actinobacteria bacterium]|nr:transposase [Actinomycetota bacterium]
KGEQATTPVPTGSLSPTAAPIIDVNVADAAMLETLPGIGPTRAAAIIAYRDEVGGFRSVDQLLEVQGIGPATLESLRDLVTV